MNNDWREWLYPLGMLPAIAFTLRFLLQWLQSEKEKKSVITPLFWKISLSGNLLLFVHALIQMQFHVCLIQACNGVISWRNLNLMHPQPRSFAQVLRLLALSAAAVPLLFILQSYLFPCHAGVWFRTPTSPWQISHSDTGWSSIVWHTIGSTALLLFNSRFWIQWWHAERSGVSALGPLFWWMSLIGAILCTCYFLHIGDIVNLLGPVSGIIPYVRNLAIIAHAKKQPGGGKSWQQTST